MNRRSLTPHTLSWQVRTSLLVLGAFVLLPACASKPVVPEKAIYESGLNVVRLEGDPDAGNNTHPITLTPTQIGTLLRGVRTWEQRNFVHRLVSGEANRTRAFRDEEITLLAPALSKALAQATAAQRVYFHLSHVTEHGEEETTTGWLSVRDPQLILALSEVHDRHGPGPDIGKYDRQMPNVPERSAAFDVTFEPEEYLVKAKSGGRLFAPEQREELYIRYREALSALPIQPGLEPRQSHVTP
ncbi:hypothetical protein W02_01530 [Nitrospira sp. KM1]|uniref:hypothetical protein n=1 Tax=Nitrospira sp. KM1 TaxID=1936990 RepID=UPI0013A78B74|nr:hypothetical protein [Nitrospira sp. KM1]BCA53013.1 hypothetical protein W02_01530 [Nitrospira sp. KM1]